MRLVSFFTLFLALAALFVPKAGFAASTADLLADRALGLRTAPVTIIEYSSLTCPHCAEFDQDTLPRLKTEYIDTGKVYFISRDFPLDAIALKAAMMARCAPPDNYFALIDLLFKGQKAWETAADPTAAMTPLGKFAGMSDEEVKTCFANDELQKGVAAERATAETKYNVDATPYFIFNNGAAKLSGAESYEKFKATIDSLIAKK